MKELKKQALTSGQGETYSMNRIKMGQEGMSSHGQKFERPRNPEQSGVGFSAKKEPVLTDGQKKRLDNAWQKHNERRIDAGEKISRGEMEAQKILKDNGILPQLTNEALELVEKVKKEGLSSVAANLKRILSENGISEDQVAGKDPEALIKMLSQKRLGNESQDPEAKEKVLNQERDISVQDQGANELIQKYFHEGGEGDVGKTEQLRLNLAQRVNDLMKERDELVRKEGARDKDGNLTAEFQKKSDEIDNKIAQILAFTSSTIRVPPATPQEEKKRESEILIEATNYFINGLMTRGLKLTEINDLSKLTPQERLTRLEIVKQIKRFLEPRAKIDSAQFPAEILLAVRHFKELREELVSEILFKSFQDESETNHYEVGLYAASNLDIILGFMNLDDPVRYKELFTLRSAAQFFHTMNSAVIVGKFAHFEDVAQSINYQHFEKMRDINGSGLVMRLFEQGYANVRAKNKAITQDEIVGLKNFVEKTFRDFNDAGLVKSEFFKYKEDPKMEEWEIQRAIAAGRTFFNITLRAAENIATGQPPMDRRRFTSPPQEDMVRILNWNQWFLSRFGLGEARKGLVYYEMSIAEYQKYLREKGAKLGLNGISEIGGMDVRKMEDGSQYRTSAVYSGWRLENMAFDKVYFQYKGEKISVQKFRDLPEIKDAIKVIKDRIEANKKQRPNADPKDWTTEEDQRDYLEVLRPILNLDYGLSMLIKNGDFGAQDNKLGYLLRTEIWKKIARTNTPLMLDYLTKLTYRWDQKNLDSLDKKIKELREKKGKKREDHIELNRFIREKEEIIANKDRSDREGIIAKPIEQLRDEGGEYWQDKEHWEAFKNKLQIKFEQSIRRSMGENMELNSKFDLDDKERSMEERIKTEGEKLSGHLADVYFAYTPFMNDMPFEEFRYDVAGQTFYKRRTTGDMGGFNKGQGAFIKIMSNPGGLTAKEAIEAMKEIEDGIGGPEGYLAASEVNFPIFSALLDVVTTDPGKRMGIVKMLLEGTRQSTSIAQRWAGIKAESFTEAEAATLVDDALRLGILTPELAKAIKRKKKLTLKYIIWMLFRDVILIPTTAAFISNLGKAVTSK